MTSTTSAPREAVAYLRVASNDETGQFTALQRQLRTCQQFARNHGVAIARVYTDTGVSGLRRRRPALDRMMRRLSGGRVRYVIASDSSRLARSQPLQLALAQQLARCGVKLIDSPDGLAAPRFLGLLANRGAQL